MNPRKLLGITAFATTAVLAAHPGLSPAQEHGEGHAMKQATVDHPAPSFTLRGIDGKEYALADYHGKYVVLEWNNPDCPFVKKYYGSGRMQALQKQYKDKNVVWLTICSSAPGKQGHYDAETLKTMFAKEKMASAAYLQDPDGVVGRAYGAKTTPHMFVIDPQGILIYAGAIDDKPSTKTADLDGATNYVQGSLDASMSGKGVATKSTTPYGCSVKYAD